MHESLLATASRLSDDALLARVKLLAGRERFASVELIAHLAELEVRNVYLGEGVKSLYRYCTEILHQGPRHVPSFWRRHHRDARWWSP